MRTFRRNRGGWPLKTKHIFDTASHRRTNLVCDRLQRTLSYLRSTKSSSSPCGVIYDPVANRGDRFTHDAMVLVHEAMRRVSEANKEAQAVAKKAATDV